MTARVRIPEGRQLLIAIVDQCDAVFGPIEEHVGKSWVTVHRNPAGVAVVGEREVLA